MSEQKTVLVRLVRDLNERRISDVEALFSADFRLRDPNQPDWPVGYEGARKMLHATLLIAPDLRIEIADLIEEADRVAARWSMSGVRAGAPFVASIVAIYRFVDGRIAEDWGLAASTAWPD